MVRTVAVAVNTAVPIQQQENQTDGLLFVVVGIVVVVVVLFFFLLGTPTTDADAATTTDRIGLQAAVYGDKLKLWRSQTLVPQT